MSIPRRRMLVTMPVNDRGEWFRVTSRTVPGHMRSGWCLAKYVANSFRFSGVGSVSARYCMRPLPRSKGGSAGFGGKGSILAALEKGYAAT